MHIILYLYYTLRGHYIPIRLIYVCAAPAARLKFRRPKTIEKPITVAAPVDDSRALSCIYYHVPVFIMPRFGRRT